MKYPYPVRSAHVDENYDSRIRLLVDLDARKLDALYVAMPATGMMGIHVFDGNKEGWSFSQLWQEAIATARLLRRQPYVRVYPENVLVPYVEITATDMDRMSLRSRLTVASMLGGVFDPDYAARWNDPKSIQQRVSQLGECVDLFAKLEGLVERKQVLQ